jgi:hypothetical protein
MAEPFPEPICAPAPDRLSHKATIACEQPTANNAAIQGQRPNPRPQAAHRIPETTTTRSPPMSAGTIQPGKGTPVGSSSGWADVAAD